MLKRKIYDELVAWKNNSKGETALMIDGARRVGKSFIVEEFAKAEYRSHIIVDFGQASQDVLDLFINDTLDFDLFFAKLSAFYSTTLYKRETFKILLFLLKKNILSYSLWILKSFFGLWAMRLLIL